MKTFRKGIELRTMDRINFVLNHGAMGDVISTLPAIIHARRTHGPSMEMHVWIPSWLYDLVVHLLAPYGTFTFRKFEDFPVKAEDQRKILDLGAVLTNAFQPLRFTRNRVDMVDYSFACLLDARPESDEERSYPTLAEVDAAWAPESEKGYVVFPVGATSSTREFKPEILGPIIARVVDMGYLPVIVGSKTSFVKAIVGPGQYEPLNILDHFDEIPLSIRKQCIDLRNTTTPLELRNICAGANNPT